MIDWRLRHTLSLFWSRRGSACKQWFGSVVSTGDEPPRRRSGCAAAPAGAPEEARGVKQDGTAACHAGVRRHGGAAVPAAAWQPAAGIL
eukprot:109563-Chlamydomonas_euryale.AAC.1